MASDKITTTAEYKMPEMQLLSIQDTGQYGISIDSDLNIFSTKSRLVAEGMIKLLQEKFRAVYDQGRAVGKESEKA